MMQAWQWVLVILSAMLMVYNLFLSAVRRKPLAQCAEAIKELADGAKCHSGEIHLHAERLVKLETGFENIVSDLREIKADVKNLLSISGDRRRRENEI